MGDARRRRQDRLPGHPHAGEEAAADAGLTVQDGYAVPPRGGDFAQWLVEKLSTLRDLNRQLAWQMAPPPLYKEGTKAQTPWLYQFLREPYRLRQTTVLRMPGAST